MKKVSITVDELLNSSDNMRIKSKEYTPELLKVYRNRWVYRVGDYLTRIFILKIPFSTKKSLSAKDLKKQMSIKNRNVFVSCTCNFWKWNGPDYNAYMNGYSERSFSDLTVPIEKDPDQQFLICKHVHAALKQFKKDNKYVQ